MKNLGLGFDLGEEDEPNTGLRVSEWVELYQTERKSARAPWPHRRRGRPGGAAGVPAVERNYDWCVAREGGPEE